MLFAFGFSFMGLTKAQSVSLYVHMLRTAFIILTIVLNFISSIVFAAEDSNTLVIGHSVPPTPINPITNSSTISANISELMFDALIEMNEDGKIQPSLAESWSVSNDGTAWMFKLKKDVKFHNGKQLTARDVAATYNAMKRGRGLISLGLSNLDSIKVLDSYNISFELKKYDSFLPVYFHLIRILPEEDLIEGIEGSKTVGTGPYKLLNFSRNGIELAAFDDHFRGRPKLKKIEVKILPSQRACLSNFIAGKLDMAFVEDSTDLKSIMGIPNIRLIDTGMRSIYFMILNQRLPALASSKVRKALNYGLNHDYIKQHIRQMEGELVDVAPYVFWAGNTEMPRFKYDPKKANDFFRMAGVFDSDGDHMLDKNGKQFTFEVSVAKGSALTSRILSLVKSAFENIGVQITISELELPELIKKVHKEKTYEATLAPIAVQGAVSLQYLFWHSKQKQTNVSSYSNPEADRLLDEIRYNKDPQARKQAQFDLAKTMLDDPPGIPLFIRKTKLLVHDRFKGFVEDSFMFFPALRDVEVKDE